MKRDRTTASGLLGNDAFAHHGLTGWLIAALGLSLHFRDLIHRRWRVLRRASSVSEHRRADGGAWPALRVPHLAVAT
jgi:hypothetical protein